MNTELVSPPDLKEVMECKQKEELLKKVCITAHAAIHNKEAKSITIDSKQYPVVYSANGYRKIHYGESITFMEQNKHKQSRYAQEARDGKHITWGIRSGEWIYIDDNGPKL